MSADALQVYSGLPILTNQPEGDALLVGIRDLGQEMSVGEYAGLAHAAIDELVEAHGVAVVAGGTGLYLRAALADLRVPPAPAPGTRERLETEYEADRDALFARLEALDPGAASVVHRNDSRRVVRALELAEAGASLTAGQDRLWGDDLRRSTLVAGLDVPAEVLAGRIVERTQEMFERGVEAEVRSALAGPISRTAEKALGLRELADEPPEQAFERIVSRTRQYAAYQRKWMRRIPGIVMIDADRPAEEVVDAIVDLARAR